MVVNVGFMEPSAFLIGVVFLWNFGLVVSNVTGIMIRPSYAMHINYVVSCTHLYAVALYFQ